MKLEVVRFNSSDDFTTGLLFDITDNVRSFLCYTLEDEARTVKQWGETRIPSGKYKLSLRSEGGFHTRYLSKFGAEFHKGMIYVNEVPNFEYILWHIGNDDDDTAGCLLVGKTSQDNFIGNSTTAYKEIYPPIRDAILSGEEVTVNYIDYDGTITSNKATEDVLNISQVSKNQEDIMHILSTEIKHLKAEIKALRQAIILKGMQVK
tara:strand:- start:1077 stop:1694 length:618 start_codon:yes stop_codon:yes gene_type:complete